MATSWGTSWLTSWLNSWGITVVTPATDGSVKVKDYALSYLAITDEPVTSLRIKDYALTETSAEDWN